MTNTISKDTVRAKIEELKSRLKKSHYALKRSQSDEVY